MHGSGKTVRTELEKRALPMLCP